MHTKVIAVPPDIFLARPKIGDEEIAAAVRVLRSGQVTQGPEVEGFESEFSVLTPGCHCVAVNSGTSALHLILLALNIGPGQEVIVPSFTFAATANVVKLCGAEPVFVDIEPDTFCMDPEAVSDAITPRTSAIIAVHLYGHPAPMEELAVLADRYGLALLEDAAQAHAAALHGRPVGTLGLAAAFSFYATKNMHTIEGGMITTADRRLSQNLRLLRNHGMATRYDHKSIGLNARMNDVSAAIGRVQLRSLPGYIAARRRNAARLTSLLSGGITTPRARKGALHVYHQYTVRFPSRRDEIKDCLARLGIATTVHYPAALHRLSPHLLDFHLPESERAATEVLSLPVHPDLTEYDIEYIAESVNKLW
jgi:perosamine synthetase